MSRVLLVYCLQLKSVKMSNIFLGLAFATKSADYTELVLQAKPAQTRSTAYVSRAFLEIPPLVHFLAVV